jgi:uncharacterized membrane protein
MTWLQRYRLRHFIANSFWITPALAMLAAIPVIRLIRWLDVQTQWQGLGFSVDGARAILGGLSSSMLTFIVFAVSGLLLAVQIASGQLTPRIIAFVFKRSVVRITVAIFVFTYAFTLGALGRVESLQVPQLLVMMTVLLTLLSVGMFFWFVQQLGAGLRPVFILESLWDAARAVVDHEYPRLLDGRDTVSVTPGWLFGDKPRIVPHAGPSGTFVAFGARELVGLARAAGCIVELVPQVGDFVAQDDPLFRIHPQEARVDERALRECVAFGAERTLEQDPAFAFRIVVDIASHALSPAVNDPTTAVLAIDQVHRLLARVGARSLDPGRRCDAAGKIRLVYPTPSWEDFVALAVSEIRLFGAGSIQVSRRLRAMLEHLIEVLPPSRIAALREQLTLLECAVDRHYADNADRQRAHHADRQGLGGSAAQGS